MVSVSQGCSDSLRATDKKLQVGAWHRVSPQPTLAANSDAMRRMPDPRRAQGRRKASWAPAGGGAQGCGACELQGGTLVSVTHP